MKVNSGLFGLAIHYNILLNRFVSGFLQTDPHVRQKAYSSLNGWCSLILTLETPTFRTFAHKFKLFYIK